LVSTYNVTTRHNAVKCILNGHCHKDLKV